MRLRTSITLSIVAIAIAADGSARAAEEATFSGFLTDYSLLEPDDYADLLYFAPGALERMKEYDSIMIDQPEIFIHPDSKYKGMKPDDMKLVADLMREILTEEISKVYQVVEEPGPGVLYFRIAFSDIFLKRKVSKNPLSYTPVGLVLKTTKTLLTKNIMKKISLVEANFEAEFTDSQSGELFGALVERRGAHKDKEKGQKADPTSWKELKGLMGVAGRRVGCRLSNAQLPEDQRTDCRQIFDEG